MSAASSFQQQNFSFRFSSPATSLSRNFSLNKQSLICLREMNIDQVLHFFHLHSHQRSHHTYREQQHSRFPLKKFHFRISVSASQFFFHRPLQKFSLWIFILM